jgi:hypothetical protein
LTDERAALQRDVARLTSERIQLYTHSEGILGLAAPDQERLRAIERQLDECFAALRRARAAGSVRRRDRR